MTKININCEITSIILTMLDNRWINSEFNEIGKLRLERISINSKLPFQL